MSRLLVLGSAPLPSERQLRLYAANLRTWHLTQPLLADGHEIRLVAGHLPKTHFGDHAREAFSDEDGFEYYSVARDLFHDASYLQRHLEEWGPDAVIGINTYPSSCAVRLDTELPIWCDLNGWVMAEAQTKCRVYDDDSFLSHFWKMEQAVLDRADVISVVSNAQAHATVGELATRGRLSNATFGYRFVTVIPNAIREIPAAAPGIVRGKLVPEDAFVVLWAGGYNTWTDVDMLFAALEAAMGAEPSLHFVSTGGAIDGHDDRTFERFRQAVRESPRRDRYHFVGWVPTEDVPRYYADANLGINIDSDNYETLYGARNRLNEWMSAGLPVLTTRGTEISRTIEDEGLGSVVPTGDPEPLSGRLVWASAHRDELAEMAERARNFAERVYSYAETTAELRCWARSPRRCPDRGDGVSFQDIDFFGPGPVVADSEPASEPPMPETALPVEVAASDAGHVAELEGRNRRLEAELEAIHSSRMWRLWMAYHRWVLAPFGLLRARPRDGEAGSR